MAKIDIDAIQNQLLGTLSNPSSGNISELLKMGSSEPGTILGYSGYGIALTILFSLIGFIYYRLGRKRSNMTQTLTGVSLLVYPIFFTKTLYLAIIGLLLCYLPTFLKKFD